MTLPQLSSRDRLALIVGGAVVLVTILVLGVVLPYRNALETLDSKIASRERQAR